MIRKREEQRRVKPLHVREVDEEILTAFKAECIRSRMRMKDAIPALLEFATKEGLRNVLGPRTTA